MSWAAASFGLSVFSTFGSGKSAKKAAAKQRALAQQQAMKLRARAAEEELAVERSIDTLRTLRSMDLPALKFANEQALLQRKKGTERQSRMRDLAQMPESVRNAVFGDQFPQYVGREIQSLGHYTDLSDRILRATETQQQRALDVEQAATSMELSGQMSAIQTEAAAGDPFSNVLGVAAQAAGQYASAQEAKAAENKDKQSQLAMMGMMLNKSPAEMKAFEHLMFGGSTAKGRSRRTTAPDFGRPNYRSASKTRGPDYGKGFGPYGFSWGF